MRNQPVAIVGVLVLRVRDRADRARARPGRRPVHAVHARCRRRVQAIPASDVGGADDLSLLSPGLAVLALLAWIGVAFAAGASRCCAAAT